MVITPQLFAARVLKSATRGRRNAKNIKRSTVGNALKRVAHVQKNVEKW
jgi:hypothetical protein